MAQEHNRGMAYARDVVADVRGPSIQMVELVRTIHRDCAVFLAAEGEPTADVKAAIELQTAARRVVWARYVRAGDGWHELKAAIDALEQIVGLPEREDLI